MSYQSSIHLSIYLSIYPPIRPSIHLSSWSNLLVSAYSDLRKARWDQNSSCLRNWGPMGTLGMLPRLITGFVHQTLEVGYPSLSNMASWKIPMANWGFWLGISSFPASHVWLLGVITRIIGGSAGGVWVNQGIHESMSNEGCVEVVFGMKQGELTATYK